MQVGFCEFLMYIKVQLTDNSRAAFLGLDLMSLNKVMKKTNLN